MTAWVILLFALEHLKPLRTQKAPAYIRYFSNVALTSIAGITGALIVRPVALSTLVFCERNSIGLLNIIDIPVYIKVPLGFMLLDLSFYYWHRLNHKVPLLWRFHNIHHLDPDMDVTTSFRFHFVEILYSSVFRIIQVAAIGVSPYIYMAYELFFSMATAFHHSNTKLPVLFEKTINFLFVTPRMHGIHHSVQKAEANSNYSVIFSVWDRLNRTLKLNVPQDEIDIGIKGYSDLKDNSIINLIIMPFAKQREYWTGQTRTMNDGDKSFKYSSSMIK